MNLKRFLLYSLLPIPLTACSVNPAANTKSKIVPFDYNVLVNSSSQPVPEYNESRIFSRFKERLDGAPINFLVDGYPCFGDTFHDNYYGRTQISYCPNLSRFKNPIINIRIPTSEGLINDMSMIKTKTGFKYSYSFKPPVKRFQNGIKTQFYRYHHYFNEK